MSMFSEMASSSTSYTWTVVDLTDSNTSTCVFNYDPETVPPGVFGGSGTMTASDNTVTPFTWILANGVMFWQLTNQSSEIETNTTTAAGSYCNFLINYSVTGFTATFVS
jgi:hypothetical protein